jgi:hypothetical protein
VGYFRVRYPLGCRLPVEAVVTRGGSIGPAGGSGGSQLTAVQQANSATIKANLLENLLAMEDWILANPEGAVLTPSETLLMAQMLVGFCRLLINETNSVGES